VHWASTKMHCSEVMLPPASAKLVPSSVLAGRPRFFAAGFLLPSRATGGWEPAHLRAAASKLSKVMVRRGYMLLDNIGLSELVCPVCSTASVICTKKLMTNLQRLCCPPQSQLPWQQKHLPWTPSEPCALLPGCGWSSAAQLVQVSWGRLSIDLSKSAAHAGGSSTAEIIVTKV